MSPPSFRQRLTCGERLLGSFVKTPTSHAVEILGDLGFDFVVVDEEHSPFDRVATDVALLAAKASGVAALVRVPGIDAAHILPVLDGGATGVLVPHVSNVATARKVAAACRYRGGTRGFSASTRAGRYGGTSRWDLVSAADEAVTVVAQIEDPEALEDLDAIAAVDGIDALFIGRGDLTVSMGLSSSEGPEMADVVARIVAAARTAGKPVCVFAATPEEAATLAQAGATAFVVSSDQGFMRREAARVLKDFRTAKPL